MDTFVKATGLTSLPNSILLMLGSHCDPVDVYSLCKTSSRFHRREFTAMETNRALATDMLHASLLSSLTNVASEKGLDVSLFTGLSAVNERFSKSGSAVVALVSGSTMVSCVLGSQTKGSDVDLFVSAMAAPAVRSHLVERGFMLTGFSDYRGFREEMNLENDVHHVENWGAAEYADKGTLLE